MPEDTSKKDGETTGTSDGQEEKPKFTQAQVDALIKQRVAREQKKTASVQGELDLLREEHEQLQATAATDADVEAKIKKVETVWKQKLTRLENENTTLKGKVDTYVQGKKRGDLVAALSVANVPGAEKLAMALSAEDGLSFDPDSSEWSTPDGLPLNDFAVKWAKDNGFSPATGDKGTGSPPVGSSLSGDDAQPVQDFSVALAAELSKG